MEMTDKPLIKEISLKTGTVREGRTACDMLVFVTGGSFMLEPGIAPAVLVASGNAFCITQGTAYRFRVAKAASLLVFDFIAGREIPGEYFPLPQGGKEPEEPDIFVLRMNRAVRELVGTARLAAAEPAAADPGYMSFKVFELCMILRAGYTVKEASAFFAPVMSRDHSFTDFVMENYLRVSTVGELVAMSPYSLSAFKRHFHKSFGGESPYGWMMRQKAARILHLLKDSRLSIKEISTGSGFRTLPQFTAFCSRNLGAPPGALRRKTGKTSI